MFTTDRIELMYGQLRWNAVFTCPDLTMDEAARSHVSLALWQESFQRGEMKMGERTVVVVVLMKFHQLFSDGREKEKVEDRRNGENPLGGAHRAMIIIHFHLARASSARHHYATIYLWRKRERWRVAHPLGHVLFIRIPRKVTRRRPRVLCTRPTDFLLLIGSRRAERIH